jgi:tRNA-2-methylthio-N6-dimethylallyladenosine synthase
MEAAVARGFREVVLLGQTVNSWRDSAHDFADLLRTAAAIDGLWRVRFTSPHPSDMTDRVIDAIAAGGAVCPQVHLPLQSGSSAVLESMNRSYTIERYQQIVARLRDAIPHVALSTDLIVGFPGETEADFQRTVDTMRATRWDSAFLFKYSARPDTKAHRWAETVDEGEKGRRLQRLIDLQQQISAERNEAWIGREVEVLVESTARRGVNQWFGRSPQFKPVAFRGEGVAAGECRRVRIMAATSQTLMGELASERPAAVPLLQIG